MLLQKRDEPIDRMVGMADGVDHPGRIILAL
jgi:hypothetical protein